MQCEDSMVQTQYWSSSSSFWCKNCGAKNSPHLKVTLHKALHLVRIEWCSRRAWGGRYWCWTKKYWCKRFPHIFFCQQIYFDNFACVSLPEFQNNNALNCSMSEKLDICKHFRSNWPIWNSTPSPRGLTSWTLAKLAYIYRGGRYIDKTEIWKSYQVIKFIKW